MCKNFLPILVVLFFTCYASIAQNLVDYKSIVNSSSEKLERLEAMDSIISISKKIDPDTFVQYSIAYIELAKEIDSIHLAAKKAIALQPVLTQVKNDPEQAIKIISSLLLHKYKITDSYLLGSLYLKRGRAYSRVNIKKSIEDLTAAIENYSEKDSLYIADAYLFRGQENSNLGKFVPAGEDYKTAYRYFERKKDYPYMLHAHQGNITMFSMNGFYEKAKKERDILIAKLKELNLNKYLPSAYYNQALDYEKTNKPALELQSLLTAESYLEENTQDKNSFVGIHGRLTEYYCRENDLANAEKHIQILEDWKPNFEGDKKVMLTYQNAKAVYLKKTGKYEEALQLAQKKLENSKSLGHEDEIMYSHLLLSEIYKEAGDYKNSLENQTAFMAIKDSLYNQSNAISLAYYQTLYETEKNERQLVEKSTNIQLLEKDNENFRKVVFFISLAVVCLFGLMLLYRNQRNLRNNKVLQEKFSQELIVSQELERMRISKDLHDGVGQHLLLLKNKLLKSNDPDAKKMVDHTIEEVRAISRDLHPFQLQELGITKAIQHTLDQIDENTSLFISSEIDNIDNIFNKEQEVNIYRIVQESLSNIIKHAAAEACRVSVKKLAKNVNIKIVDNGIGFDSQEKFQDLKSLGLKTLLERTKFLNGTMKIQSRKDEGTLLEFQFPYA